MLAKVPVYELKIDRSFVSAMNTSPEAMAVVRSTVELGRSLSRLVVAEGVERPDQRLALWEMGCRAGQGHLFGHPMPADALLSLLTQRHRWGHRAAVRTGARGRAERDRPAPAPAAAPAERRRPMLRRRRRTLIMRPATSPDSGRTLRAWSAGRVEDSVGWGRPGGGPR